MVGRSKHLWTIVVALTCFAAIGITVLWKVTSESEVIFTPRGLEMVIGRTVRVENRAEIKRRYAFEYRKLVAGTALVEGDSIRTYPNSAVVIDYVSGNQLTTEGDSWMVIGGSDKRRENSGTIRTDRAAVNSGAVVGKVKEQINEISVLEMRTPGALARMDSRDQKGEPGELRVLVDSVSKSFEIKVLRGTVLAGVDEQHLSPLLETQVLGSNQRERITEAIAYREVTLAAPSDGTIIAFAKKEGLNLGFKWHEFSGARDYSFELSADPVFKEIVLASVVSKPELNLRYLDPGDYYWRVRPMKMRDVGWSSIWKFHLRIK